MGRKSPLLKKVTTFFNKTSRRPNAYSTWTGKSKSKYSKVHPAPQKRGKESMSEQDKRLDHESAVDPKGKKGWRTKENNMVKKSLGPMV